MILAAKVLGQEVRDHATFDKQLVGIPVLLFLLAYGIQLFYVDIAADIFWIGEVNNMRSPKVLCCSNFSRIILLNLPVSLHGRNSFGFLLLHKFPND